MKGRDKGGGIEAQFRAWLRVAVEGIEGMVEGELRAWLGAAVEGVVEGVVEGGRKEVDLRARSRKSREPL